MKKKFALMFSSLLIVLATVATLCGCTSYPNVRKTFENKGWSEVESAKDAQVEFAKRYLGEDYESVCTLHVLGENGSIANYVVIAEFDSTEEMEECMDQSAALKGLIQDIQTSKLVSGNCVLLFWTPLGGGNTIFESTK